MFEPVVTCARVDEVSTSELFDIPQSLELWSVDNLDEEGVKLHGPMDRVIDELEVNKKKIVF